MPVPKTTTVKTTAADTQPEEPTQPEPQELEADLPGDLDFARFDFDRRSRALELAINARELDPVGAARDYYDFLAGDTPATTEA